MSPAYCHPTSGRDFFSTHFDINYLPENPWIEPELTILERYAWMSDERIRLKLKAAGYSRSATGIHLKLRRMQFKHNPSFYSARGLAQALGIDSHVVPR
ncbi:MAG TPA: hypothetical protein VEK33_24910 [Terriglobales bacterium]|nr:hypothetical protein [Terriglobales bacterium]